MAEGRPPLKYAFSTPTATARLLHPGREPMSEPGLQLRAQGRVPDKQAWRRAASTLHGGVGRASTAQVVGYTGHFPGDRYSIDETFPHSSQHLMEHFKATRRRHAGPAEAPHFPDCHPRPEPQMNLSWNRVRLAAPRSCAPPSRASNRLCGWSPGHQHAPGKPTAPSPRARAGPRARHRRGRARPGPADGHLRRAPNLQPAPRRQSPTCPSRAARGRCPAGTSRRLWQDLLHVRQGAARDQGPGPRRRLRPASPSTRTPAGRSPSPSARSASPRAASRTLRGTRASGRPRRPSSSSPAANDERTHRHRRPVRARAGRR